MTQGVARPSSHQGHLDEIATLAPRGTTVLGGVSNSLSGVRVPRLRIRRSRSHSGACSITRSYQLHDIAVRDPPLRLAPRPEGILADLAARTPKRGDLARSVAIPAMKPRSPWRYGIGTSHGAGFNHAPTLSSRIGSLIRVLPGLAREDGMNYATSQCRRDRRPRGASAREGRRVSGLDAICHVPYNASEERRSVPPYLLTTNNVVIVGSAISPTTKRRSTILRRPFGLWASIHIEGGLITPRLRNRETGDTGRAEGRSEQYHLGYLCSRAAVAAFRGRGRRREHSQTCGFSRTRSSRAAASRTWTPYRRQSRT